MSSPDYEQALRDLELADRLAVEVEKYLRARGAFAPMWYSDLFSVLIDYKVKRGLGDVNVDFTK